MANKYMETKKCLIGITIVLLIFFVVIPFFIGGYVGYKEGKVIREMMPISEGGLGLCNKICIENGNENGCFVPSEPRCDCNAGNIENYRYCEEEQ